MPCESCLHYHDSGALAAPMGPVDLASAPKHSSGECRRFPPQVLMLVVGPGQVAPGSMFPPVQPDHECGEYVLVGELKVERGTMLPSLTAGPFF